MRVVVLLVRRAGARRAPGMTGPCSSSHRRSSSSVCSKKQTLFATGKKTSRRRSRATGKRRTVTPFTCETPAGQDVLPAQVVGGGGGEDLDLVALGHVLRDPAAVQLGPADHLRPVALDDEGEPHPRPPSFAASVSFCERVHAVAQRRRLDLEAHQLPHEVVAEVVEVEVDLGLAAQRVVGVEPHPGPHELLQLHHEPRPEARAVGLDAVVGGDVPVVVGRHEPREQLRVDPRVVGEGLELERGQLLDLLVGVEPEVPAPADLLPDAGHDLGHVHPAVARRPLVHVAPHAGKKEKGDGRAASLRSRPAAEAR